MSGRTDWVIPFARIGADDLARVGGKNASLGEMIAVLSAEGIAVPTGFATTASAYRAFVAENALAPVIARELDALHSGARPLREVGEAIRRAFLAGRLPAMVRDGIVDAYRALQTETGLTNVAVAVRSSATAEDLPHASFAGQQETYLNVVGEQALLEACVKCIASLYTDRAISYREANHFAHESVALSVGVQQMVRSDIGAAGVMFTLETETGFPLAVLINASWGLGESVVKGSVDPDEILLFKPGLARAARRPILRKRLGSKETTMVLGTGPSESPTRVVPTDVADRARFAISDEDAITLARWAVRIEDHYSARAGHRVPMDVEWARDGATGRLYIVQARPETVQSRAGIRARVRRRVVGTSAVLARGRSVGTGAAAGRARVLRSPSEPFEDGAILVTEMTDPDWLPLMRRAAAIVTDHGGRTCHAAILSRELGIPAIVGTNDGTRTLVDGAQITVACGLGEDGLVFEGALEIDERMIDETVQLKTRTKVMMNLADPGSALRNWRVAADGIGLARMEFIIANEVRVHPMALLHPERIGDATVRAEVERLRAGETRPGAWFVETLARGVAMLAASQYPKPVIVRLSDFKTNEYSGLLGGRDFEPHEENPMIGFRGASRYAHPRYREGFLLECEAMRMAREEIGLDNIVLMIPFCRTPHEADTVLATMADAGLSRGVDGLEVYVMCEIPSNVILAEEFARRFDGFSIGSNDLTQLTLGVDRDSEILAESFNERDAAVTTLIRDVIRRAHAVGVPVGLCGQAPSDDPTFADLLVDAGIDSISVDPDSVEGVRARVHHAEHAGARTRRVAAQPLESSARAEQLVPDLRRGID
ncbi:MAG: phosphoenolpyruvate synthase [Gemmatimonadaceae bacterium]